MWWDRYLNISSLHSVHNSFYITPAHFSPPPLLCCELLPACTCSNMTQQHPILQSTLCPVFDQILQYGTPLMQADETPFPGNAHPCSVQQDQNVQIVFLFIILIISVYISNWQFYTRLKINVHGENYQLLPYMSTYLHHHPVMRIILFGVTATSSWNSH